MRWYLVFSGSSVKLAMTIHDSVCKTEGMMKTGVPSSSHSRLQSPHLQDFLVMHTFVEI